ncbi:alpha-(1,3)-fucosyltransferase C-like [Penaeus japonicus]|uniref:alpha-(1,3)-fucosyltransferase C-like n=1 Tax=Penaeus japonicus TaxID=27405 RepID=UPI001C70B5D1|nr:alpha-(1,3)-fucosyltransferase C-like [Penaeus japonicus]
MVSTMKLTWKEFQRMDIKAIRLMGVVALWRVFAFTVILALISTIYIQYNLRDFRRASVIRSAQRPSKRILIWNVYYDKRAEEWERVFHRLLNRDCPVSDCDIVYDHRFLDTADAVLLKRVQDDVLPDRHPEGQVWVFFSLEALQHYDWRIPDEARHIYNWTMTYHSFSDVVVPYGRVTLLPSHAHNHSLSPENRNYWREKNKDGVLVAWMVSHCHTASNREGYVAHLQRFMEVDIYGKCGPKSCADRFTLSRLTPSHEECFQIMGSYMFYLAFENAICTDYVTEKLFKTLQLDVIPVVFGGADYASIAPPNSYINALDFLSPIDLVEYLKKVASNETLYNSYFRWKGKYKVDLGHPVRPLVCDICAKLHGEPVVSAPKPWRSKCVASNQEGARDPEGTYSNIEGTYRAVDNLRAWDSQTYTLRKVYL